MKLHRIMSILLLILPSCYAQFSLYLEQQIQVPTESVTCIQMSKDGRFLSYGDGSGKIYVWDIGAGRQLHILKEHRSQVNSIIFDSKSQRLISGGSDGKIIIWDLYSGRMNTLIKDFGSPIQTLDLTPDDRILAAAGRKKEVFLWEFPLGSMKGRLRGHKKNVVGCAFSVNGDQLLSVSEDRNMIVWNVNTLQLVRKTSIESRTMKGSGIDIISCAFSFDRNFVGIGVQEHVLAKGGRRMIFQYNLSFFDWRTGSEIETLTGNRKDIEFFTISPDKRYAITDNSTLRSNQLSFWNIQTGVVEQNYPIDGKISTMQISENGEWFAAGYKDPNQSFRCNINVWRLSGMDGYQRFASDQPVRSSGATGFGASIKLTTPEAPLIQFGSHRRLAILYFDSPGLNEDIARTTTYLFEGKLGNSPFVELIERNQIENVLSELQYQMSGLTTSNAVEVGKHLNAEFVLLGSINKLGSLLIITAKLVNVETSQIEGTREVQCANATIENIADMVSVLGPTIAKY